MERLVIMHTANPMRMRRALTDMLMEAERYSQLSLHLADTSGGYPKGAELGVLCASRAEGLRRDAEATAQRVGIDFAEVVKWHCRHGRKSRMRRQND